MKGGVILKRQGYKIKKHRSHISGRRAKSRPFGKFAKFSAEEGTKWQLDKKEVNQDAK